MTTGRRHLVCPYGCQPGRFELIGGAVYVDSEGRYLSHDGRMASYRCEICGSVAIDLAAAAAARLRDTGAAAAATVICPSCQVRLLPPEDLDPTSQLECPGCGAVFSFEEGSQHLLGSFSEPEVDEEES